MKTVNGEFFGLVKWVFLVLMVFVMFMVFTSFSSSSNQGLSTTFFETTCDIDEDDSTINDTCLCDSPKDEDGSGYVLFSSKFLIPEEPSHPLYSLFSYQARELISDNRALTERDAYALLNYVENKGQTSLNLSTRVSQALTPEARQENFKPSVRVFCPQAQSWDECPPNIVEQNWFRVVDGSFLVECFTPYPICKQRLETQCTRSSS